MRLLYQFSIACYVLAIRLASPLSEKARQWLNGRARWQARMPGAKTRERYWFHCASLGEFEQARPIMEYYASRNIEICISFFSPSGYEIRKNWEPASWIGYLPVDTAASARRFVRSMDADKVFFVKYEFWYFFLNEIGKSGVPFYLISARLRSEQPFFRWYGSLHRKMLHNYTLIFTQDTGSVDLLNSIGYDRGIHAGDTRFDRVLAMKEQRQELPLIRDFCSGHFTLAAGSCWPPEETLITAAMAAFPEFRWVLVPHDIGESHLQELENRFPGKSIRYSELEKGTKPGEYPVLLVDCIGLLGSIYPYCQVAMVGGGFKNGLHNILEAAVWGMPVLFGNRTEKNPEGKNLIRAGGGIELANGKDLIEALRRLKDGERLRTMGQNAAEWVKTNSGATAKIIEIVGQ